MCAGAISSLTENMNEVKLQLARFGHRIDVCVHISPLSMVVNTLCRIIRYDSALGMMTLAIYHPRVVDRIVDMSPLAKVPSRYGNVGIQVMSGCALS